MDPFTGAVTITQGVAYCSTLISSLAELYNITKNGRQIFREHYSNIEQLHLVINQLLERGNITVTPNLHRLLKSVEQTVQQLLHFFNQSKRLKIVTILLIRQKTVNEAFTSLERHKTTLLVYLATENLDPTTSMGGFRNKPKKLSSSHRSRLQKAPPTPPTQPLTPFSDEVMPLPENSASHASTITRLPYSTLPSKSHSSTNSSSANDSTMDVSVMDESDDIPPPPNTDHPNLTADQSQADKEASNCQRGDNSFTKSRLVSEDQSGNKTGLGGIQRLFRHPDVERVITNIKDNIVGENATQEIGIIEKGAFEVIMKHRYGRN